MAGALSVVIAPSEEGSVANAHDLSELGLGRIVVEPQSAVVEEGIAVRICVLVESTTSSDGGK